MTASPSGFDALAAGYDQDFGASAIGRIFRLRVQARLDACFHAGQKILELNCGTGEDAIHLALKGARVLATDESAAMLAVADRKVRAAGLAGLVELRPFAIEELGQLGPASFDGALSNLGGLNCVAELAPVGRDLARLLKPGAVFLGVIMGPLAAWEWVWFAARGPRPRVFRRLRAGGTPWRGKTIRYPSAFRAARAFGPGFAVRRISALGALVPGSYAEPWAARHPRALARLDRLERALSSAPPVWMLADHYILELVRRPLASRVGR